MKRITHATAKYVLGEMFRTGEEAQAIIERENLWELTPEETEQVIDEILKANPKVK